MGRASADRPLFDGKPLFDVLQAVYVNLFLLVLYVLLLTWCVASVVLMMVFINTLWPITLSMACAATTLIVHFAILGTGVVLVRGFDPYPLKPRGVYQFVDFGLALFPILVVASYSARPTSSTVPLVAGVLLAVCLTITIQKIVVVSREVLSNNRDPVTGESLV
jgi:hypothetical protein